MAPPQSDPPLSLPSHLGRYRVVRRIGSGGMATVVLARLDGAGGFSRNVAIKMLHPHLLSDAEVVRHFLTEARVAAAIQHSNIVSVIDIGEVSRSAPFAYLVMEHVPGDSLSGLQGRARELGVDLPPRITLRILADALTGLDAAHEATSAEGVPLGIVHRDFTPQNILVGGDGVAKLTDFGIVKVGAAEGHTATGIVKGTPRFLAPEQVRGQRLDRRCDVWAAGVLAWELFARTRLHPPGDVVALFLRIASADPPHLGSVWPEAPAKLDETIAWALTRDRAARCPTARALRDRLLDAWTASGGEVATHGETASMVARLCGEARGGETAWVAPTPPILATSTGSAAAPVVVRTATFEARPGEVSVTGSQVATSPASSTGPAIGATRWRPAVTAALAVLVSLALGAVALSSAGGHATASESGPEVLRRLPEWTPPVAEAAPAPSPPSSAPVTIKGSETPRAPAPRKPKPAVPPNPFE